MRCYECGYQNNSDTRVCVKCGTKLSSSNQSPEVSPPPAVNIPAEQTDGKRTMVGRSSEAPSWDGGPPARSASGSSASAGVQRCEKCGYYPLRMAVSAAAPCPNCGFTGDASQSASGAGAPSVSNSAASAHGGTSPEQGSAAPSAGGSGISPTPTPTPAPKAKPSDGKTRKLTDFSVGDSSNDEPVIVLTDEKTGKKLAFSGVQVSLNRADLDPSNETISSKEHLTVSIFDGRLIVQDKSSNGATFVQAKERTQVSPGSRIIIGNKVYTIEIAES